MDVGKIPPHDVEAEQAVIGAMLIDKEAVTAALEKLRDEDFYREDNKLIFEAITSLYQKNEPIDIITVKSELTEAGTVERVGGLEYLSSLPDKVPTTANVDRYINIVREKALLRRLITSGNEMVSLGYNEAEDVDNILDMAERKIMDLSQNKAVKGYSTLQEVLVSSVSKLEELFKAGGKISGTPTGFTDLDYKMSGLHDGELIILAARPAMGKSALAINIATNVALKANKGVVIFSLEMPKEQIANRIMSSEALIDSNKIRSGLLEDDDWTKLSDAINEISGIPLYIEDDATLTITDIRTRCRKLHMEKGLGLIVIDYLQLISPLGKKNASREQEISEISRSLKILAKELGVPVIALSQLSRGVEKRDDKRPLLSDLRESGSIEQDADIVIFLYRDDYYNKDSERKNVTEVILAKNRAGSIGTVDLAWLPSYTKFANLAKQDEDDM
jgi:replicative DNA helicase